MKYLHALSLLALSLQACAIWQETPPPENRCDEARDLLLGCGATVALFERASCSGPALFGAECVIEHGGACEDLGTMSEACARVISDALAGVDLPERPGEECMPPAALAPGTVFAVDAQMYRVDGLTYCACTDSPSCGEGGAFQCDDLCAPPTALVATESCSTPCSGDLR